MPRRRVTQRERALEALIKVATGHGPFYRQLFKFDGEPWQRNGYNGCHCIFVCAHCNHLVVLCPKHGDIKAIGHLRVTDDVYPGTFVRGSVMKSKLGARWPA